MRVGISKYKLRMIKLFNNGFLIGTTHFYRAEKYRVI
jgi:hypothetical protein